MLENNLPQLDNLFNLTTEFANRLESLKRPLIIEFAGTPKAGKTTCVNAIAKFLQKKKISVHIVTERASVCPIANKHHLYFNTWTGVTSLSQMLESKEKQSNVIILDRGLFDTLVWMDFLQVWQAVTPDDLNKIESFFLLNRWTSLIDIVVTLSVDPNIALEREFKDQILREPGSIMNKANLEGYNSSLYKAMEKYKDKFNILHIDTTNTETVKGITKISYELLSVAHKSIDEDIAVVNREFVINAAFNNGVIKRAEDIISFLNEIPNQIKWVKRDEAEKNLSLVQLIPVVVIKRDEEILVMNIRGEKHGRLAEHNSIWAGGHVRDSDATRVNRGYTQNIFHGCVYRELEEELQLSIFNLMDIPDAIIWDSTTSRSSQHLGIFYEFKMSSKAPKEALHLKEFYESKNKSLFTQFRTLDSNLKNIKGWEKWSQMYLREVCKIEIPLNKEQSELF